MRPTKIDASREKFDIFGLTSISSFFRAGESLGSLFETSTYSRLDGFLYADVFQFSTRSS